MKIFLQLIICGLCISNFIYCQVLKSDNGINTKNINSTIHRALGKTEYLDNVIRIATWNIYDDPKDSVWNEIRDDVCNFIKRSVPLALGLQEVRKDQLDFLKKCLPNYKAIAIPKDALKESLYTPIFYRYDLRQFKFVRSGTFWLSDKLSAKLSGSKLPTAQHPRLCTWMHMRFASRLTPYPLSKGSHVYRNFMWLRQVIGLPRRAKPRRRKRTKWRWRDIIIANTDLDSKNPDVAKSQLKFLFDYLYKVELPPRDYPVILTGDMKWEGDATVSQAIKDVGGLTNSMKSSRVTYPAIADKGTHVVGSNIVDYVWQKKLTGVLSGEINDRLKKLLKFKPVFSAFIL